MNRTERLLDLIAYLLNSGEPVSWQEIKNHFPEDYAKGVEESNQRKFERDKAELISLGIPIDYQGGREKKREGYIIRKEKLFLPEIEFTPQESSLLMLSASAVREHDDFPYRDQLEAALLKLVSLQEILEPPPAQISITYSEHYKETPRAPFIREIQDALERRKRVEFVYHAFSTGKTKRRKVNPYGLIFRRGSWVLVGWDHLRKDLRSFVLARIRKLEVNPRRPGTPDFEIPPDFSLQRFRDQQPWEYHYHRAEEIDVEVAPHRLPELGAHLESAQPLGDNSFRLRVTNRSGLISWVLSEKSDLRVLRPEAVRREIRQRVQELL